MRNISNTGKMLDVEDGHLNTQHWFSGTGHKSHLLSDDTVRNYREHKRPILDNIIQTHDNLIGNVIPRF